MHDHVHRIASRYQRRSSEALGMVELRELVESLGNTNVRTLLNSGKVIFQAQRPKISKLAHSIEAVIQTRFGFSAPVVTVTAVDLTAITQQNPLPTAANEPSKYLVPFVPSWATLAKAQPLLGKSWAPEAIAIDKRAAYLSCVNGIIESKVLKAFECLRRGSATTRNWTPILKYRSAWESVDSKEIR